MAKLFNHKTYPKAFIRLRPSRIIIGEVGAFALKEFKKGEIIVKAQEFEDENILSVAEYNKLDAATKNLTKAHSTITPEKLFVPRNLNLLRPINYFNHSCNPNVGFDRNDNYVAIKSIRKNAEFLLDYSFLNTNPDYEMDCSCGSQHCRKVITGNEWKEKKYVEKSRKHFASTLRGLL